MRLCLFEFHLSGGLEGDGVGHLSGAGADDAAGDGDTLLGWVMLLAEGALVRVATAVMLGKSVGFFVAGLAEVCVGTASVLGK